jgi:acetyl-CoA carboxylase biotin carboxylase subunit
MFKKLLVANRGEIALRIVRACREMRIKAVVVFSEADSESLPVRFADEALCIGASASSESYLNMPRIVSAAEITNADAIHPGYGFLAENPEFREAIESCNIAFVGPSAENMRLMGDKALAREAMARAGVPVIPGSDGPVETLDNAKEVAETIEYPLLLKAVAGGGGRGMRIVYERGGLESAFAAAAAEAEVAFGDGRLYIERFLKNPRHIEFQIAGDGDRCIHFGERECSIQRRHQKLLEEAPSTALSTEAREEMGRVAIKGADMVGYHGLGTMEFLLDEAGRYYFIEMNTRIQVEHPVTECITGVDLVKLQIRLAAGETLSGIHPGSSIDGHSIECRINAEDPDRGFAPCPGRIEAFHQPGGPGVRVDTHVYAGYVVPPHYDSLLAKVITHGTDRDEALARMERTLDELVIEGVKTTTPFHKRVLRHPEFHEGKINTGFIERMEQEARAS